MNPATQPLRCLLVEDSDDDARLILRELCGAGFVVTSERVDTREAMREALARGPWDIVLSDNEMPYFSGMAALELLHGTGLDLPFIIVSGTIFEDDAVTAMRAGAHDYLAKDRLARLGPAVHRELANAKVRRTHRQGEAELRKAAERLRAIIETAMDGFWRVDPRDTRLLEVNQTYARMSGYTVEELLTLRVPDLEAVETSAETAEHMQKLMDLGEDRFETVHRRKDGSVFDVEISTQFRSGEGGGIVSFLRDVTGRKAAEVQQRESEAALTKQVEELRRWYQATRGREARVSQLKKEVNAVLARLGEPPRYPSVEGQDGPPDGGTGN